MSKFLVKAKASPEECEQMFDMVARKRATMGLAPAEWDYKIDKVFPIYSGEEFLGGLVFRLVWEAGIFSDDPRIAEAVAECHHKIKLALGEKLGRRDIYGLIPRSLVDGERKRGMQKIMERANFERLEHLAVFRSETEEVQRGL